MHPLAATLQGAAAVAEMASVPAARAFQAAGNLAAELPPHASAPQPPLGHNPHLIWGLGLTLFCAGLAIGWHLGPHHDRS